MTTANTLLIVAYCALLGIYGYAHSMTAEGFPIQGMLGTAFPVLLGLGMFALGLARGLRS